MKPPVQKTPVELQLFCVRDKHAHIIGPRYGLAVDAVREAARQGFTADFVNTTGNTYTPGVQAALTTQLDDLRAAEVYCAAERLREAGRSGRSVLAATLEQTVVQFRDRELSYANELPLSGRQRRRLRAAYNRMRGAYEALMRHDLEATRKAPTPPRADRKERDLQRWTAACGEACTRNPALTTLCTVVITDDQHDNSKQLRELSRLLTGYTEFDKVTAAEILAVANSLRESFGEVIGPGALEFVCRTLSRRIRTHNAMADAALLILKRTLDSVRKAAKKTA